MAGRELKTTKHSRLRLYWGVIIFFIALTTRMIHLFSQKGTAVFSFLTMDPLYYHQQALAIVSGQIFGAEVFFKAPLYQYFLALIYMFFDDSLFAAMLVQVIISSLSCVLIFFLAEQFYSRKIAAAAGIIAAFYGPLIYFATEPLIPTLIIFLNLSALLLLFRFQKNGKAATLFGAALVFGLSAIARPNVLIFVPGVLAWLYLLVKKERRKWANKAVIFSVGMIVMILPVTIHNYIVGHELVVFGNYGGLNFAIGNNPQADGSTAVLPGTSPEFWQGYYDAATIANKRSGRELTPGEVSDYWLGQGLKYIVADPFSWLRLELKKLALILGSYEIANNKQIYFFAARSPILKFLLWDKLIAFPFGIVLPLALIGLYLRKRDNSQFLLDFFVISYIISILLFFVTARFRLPVIPFFIIWAAAGLVGLMQLYRRGKFKEFYRAFVVVLAAIILLNGLSYVKALSPRQANEYEGYLYAGRAYFQARDYQYARDSFLQAIRLNPQSPRALNSLASSYSRLGENQKAIEFYQRAMDADPTYELPKKNLAALYRRTGDLNGLYGLIEKRARQDNAPNWILREWGYLHGLLAEWELAAEIYQRAYDADTTDHEALFRVSEAFLKLDFRQEAESTLQHFLRLEPNSVEAHANLGQVFARQEQTKAALSQFLWVRDREPNEPSSYFNLASIYLQMGNLQQAQAMIDRVRSLNPDYPSLQQLQQMIDEAKLKQ